MVPRRVSRHDDHLRTGNIRQRGAEYHQSTEAIRSLPTTTHLAHRENTSTRCSPLRRASVRRHRSVPSNACLTHKMASSRASCSANHDERRTASPNSKWGLPPGVSNLSGASKRTTRCGRTREQVAAHTRRKEVREGGREGEAQHHTCIVVQVVLQTRLRKNVEVIRAPAIPAQKWAKNPSGVMTAWQAMQCADLLPL